MRWLFASVLATILSGPGSSGEAVKLHTTAGGMELSRFHAWTIELPPGPAVTSIHFDAAMPAHGHGLADQPRLEQLGERKFRVDGVRFHMPGEWLLRVRYQDSRPHSVTFPFQVSYASSRLRSFWLGSRGPIRPDPTNRYASHAGAAAMGKELFFDTRLSGDGTTSCATCHRPEAAFADNRRFSKPGVKRNSQGLLGVSESPWLFWDGRRDSLWSQALLPIESPVEMAGSREAVARLVRTVYRERYRQITGLDPAAAPVDRVFADVGKFLAAYECTLQPSPSRFDRYVEDLEAGRPSSALSADEQAGLEIFLSPEARCTQCHNGPLFTNQGFHNIGTASLDGDTPDFGRAMGIVSLGYDRFNCRSEFSDSRDWCGGLEFARQDGHDGLLTGAFKVPSLRDVALTAPYMHDGSLATIEQVIGHYRNPPKVRSELKPLVITAGQAGQLAAFLRSLTGE
jgi:cytochrome c peroxidase